MLRIVGRRRDGYHLLQTVFQFLDHSDWLWFDLRDDGVIEREGEVAGVSPDADLMVRAARLLQQVTGARLGATMRISKQLPMGGGLGGGSSDAATRLVALNQYWQTGLTLSGTGGIRFTTWRRRTGIRSRPSGVGGRRGRTVDTDNTRRALVRGLDPRWFNRYQGGIQRPGIDKKLPAHHNSRLRERRRW